jgi:hypothetical protein
MKFCKALVCAPITFLINPNEFLNEEDMGLELEMDLKFF